VECGLTWSGDGMAKLNHRYDVVVLRKDLRQNRSLDAPEIAIHLDQIRDGHIGCHGCHAWHPWHLARKSFFPRPLTSTDIGKLSLWSTVNHGTNRRLSIILTLATRESFPLTDP
jgi:hypothetical protein